MTNDSGSLVPSPRLIAALHAAERLGFRVTPLEPGGKLPLRKGWQVEALSTPDIHELWTQTPEANVGIVTGPRLDDGGSGVLVLDLDVKNGIDGIATIRAAEVELGPLPKTYNITTPSGGRHLYFRYPDASDEWRNWQGWRAGVDVRGWHGFVLAPGSDLDDRPGQTPGSYEVASPDGREIASLPAAWLEALRARPADLAERPEFAPVDVSKLTVAELERARAYAEAEVDALCQRMAEHAGPGKHGTLKTCGIILGSWAHLLDDPHEAATRLLTALERSHRDDGTIDQLRPERSRRGIYALMEIGAANPKWPTGAALTVLGNLADYGLEARPFVEARQVTMRSWDDIGNADRLIDHAGERIRFATDSEQWLVYGDGVWSAGSAPTLTRRAMVETLEAIVDLEGPLYSDAPNFTVLASGKDSAPKPSDRDNFSAFVSGSRTAAKMTAAILTASASPAVATTMTSFDAEPLLLCVANGILDLETGKLSEHSPAAMMTQRSPVAWTPGATCPTWLAYLSQVQPDPEIRAYLQQVAGYTLTGSTVEQVMFLHYGTGGNGKSVWVDTIARIMGSYAQTVPRSALLLKRSDGIPNDIARMRGKRLLRTSETKAGEHLDMGLIKDLTGGEELSARHMRAEFFDFRPVAKIHLSTNHLPHVTAGASVERRLRDIAWRAEIPDSERDPNLIERIAAQELPGVLAWAVEGTRAWLAAGKLTTPLSVAADTLAHIAASDPLAEWLDVRVARVPGAQVALGVAYADYASWAESRGRKPMGDNNLSHALSERGFDVGKDSRTRQSVVNGAQLLPTAVDGSLQAYRRLGAVGDLFAADSD